MTIVLPVITARGGSKGVRRKNVRLLDGKPLIAHTIACARALGGRLETVVVSTEDEEIAAVSRQFGADVPFRRPAALAQDDTPSLPVVQHALDFIERSEGRTFDWILLLQPTSPLREPQDILALLDAVEDGAPTSAVTVTNVTESHPLKLRLIEDGWLRPWVENAPEAIRRQDLKPAVYKTNGAGYLARRDMVMQQNTLYGPHVRPVIMPPERSLDINSEWDFLLAEFMLKRVKGMSHDLR